VRIRVVDAFADRPFSGNPAAVCLLEMWPTDEWMRGVAGELNLSETAFAVERPDGDWELRWFTPAGVEVDLCGHATLATAHVLGRDARFHTRSGVLLARVGEEITLDFPANPPVAAEPPDGFAAALGAAPAEVHRIDALRELVAVFEDERTVRALDPDLAAIRRLDGVRGVVVTAPAREFDFLSRVFLPAAGIPEDPVTGGAHTALAPFWAARLGRESLVGYQASARGGVVRMRLRGDRVELSGRAVTVIDGELSA
jgi:predicted PhzF superfamily epimerase YddE/YHI9